MTFRPKDSQDRILHRLKIAHGHLEKVIKMVKDGDYCIDIIHQSQAIQSALRQADSLTLENHLKTCVVEHIQKGETEKTVNEIMKVIRKTKDVS